MNSQYRIITTVSFFPLIMFQNLIYAVFLLAQECTSDQWQCKVGPCEGCGNGTCIDRASLCDNGFDCEDRSDEENCK